MTFPALGYDQEADFEEGRPTDADALSPDWDQTADMEEGDLTDFDFTSGGAGVSAANVSTLEGSWVARVDFGAGSSRRYFGLNGPTTEQGTVVYEAQMDLSGLTMGDGENIRVADLAEGDGLTVGTNSAVFLQFSNANGFQLQQQIVEDDGTSTAGSLSNTVSGVVSWRVVLHYASSNSASDAEQWFYVNGQLVDQLTGKDLFDDISESITWGETNSAGVGTSGTIDFDMCQWSNGPGSPVWITEAAALAGSYGAAFTIEDTTGRYIKLTGPTNETTVTLELKFDPNSLTMSDGDQMSVVRARGSGNGGDFLQLLFGKSSGNFEIQALYDDDTTTSNTGTSFVITDSSHTIRAVLIASSGPGNNDGEIHLYSDGVLLESLTGLDNDGHDIDEIWFGATGGIDSGTSGVFFMDDMRWADDVILPQSNAGSLSPSGALTTLYTQFINLAGSISPSGALSTAATFAQSVAGSISPSGALTTAFQIILDAAARFVATITQDAHYDDTVEGAARYDNEIEQDAHLG